MDDNQILKLIFDEERIIKQRENAIKKRTNK